MGESKDAAQLDAVESLRREIAAARVLLAAQREVEAALRSGIAGEPLLARVRAQEDAAAETAAAARSRRIHFPGPGSLEEEIRAASGPRAALLRSLGAEASDLREEIRRGARRAEYVARRSLEWSQGQMDLLIRWVSGEGATYGNPGTVRPAGRIPSLMDRTA